MDLRSFSQEHNQGVKQDLGVSSFLSHQQLHYTKHSFGPELGPIYKIRTGFLSWGRSVNHRPPSSAEVKERVELYVNSSSGPSWPVLG
jgi:hypothetical protein